MPIEFIEPNFSLEWVEAKRYPELFRDVSDWLKQAKTGMREYWLAIENEYGPIGNTDAHEPSRFPTLVDFKQARFERNYAGGKLELPIIIRSPKFNNSKPDLLAGNTRLTGLLYKGLPKGNIPIWFIDLT